MKHCFKARSAVIKLVWLMCLAIVTVVSCRQEKQIPPPPRALVTNSLFDIFFLDRQKGWAVGKLGMVVATTDGGDNWQAQKRMTDYNLRGIYFLNDREGWIVGDTGTVLHTANAGELWMLQESGTKCHLRDVYFFDANAGLAVGEQGVVLVTGNGGKDWKERTDLKELFVVEDNPFLAALYGICFVDEKKGWISGDYGIILSTTDGGGTWKKQETGTADLFMDIYFVDPYTGWAAGESGSIIQTADGGNTWQRQESGVTTLINSITCNDVLNCYAITYGSMLQTGDGGVTWEILFDDKKMWFYGMDTEGKDNIWVAADYGEIIYSRDGGKNWMSQIPWEARSSPMDKGSGLY